VQLAAVGIDRWPAADGLNDRLWSLPEDERLLIRRRLYHYHAILLPSQRGSRSPYVSSYSLLRPAPADENDHRPDRALGIPPPIDPASQQVSRKSLVSQLEFWTRLASYGPRRISNLIDRFGHKNWCMPCLLLKVSCYHIHRLCVSRG
jgi:hypothetical protein